MPGEPDYDQRGLLKLMLKMPALRGRLQIVSARDNNLLSLCGAFEEASATLDRLRRQRLESDAGKISEYERICDEIEQEIISICYHK